MSLPFATRQEHRMTYLYFVPLFFREWNYKLKVFFHHNSVVHGIALNNHLRLSHFFQPRGEKIENGESFLYSLFWPSSKKEKTLSQLCHIMTDKVPSGMALKCHHKYKRVNYCYSGKGSPFSPNQKWQKFAIFAITIKSNWWESLVTLALLSYVI